MYGKILVPVVLDHHPNIDNALAVARELLAKGGEIVLLHVIEEVPGYILAQVPSDLVASSRAETEAKLAAIARTAGVSHAVISGHASRSIVDYAAEKGMECIVVASHRPGLQDYLIGSTAARVVRHAHCSVHVIR